ncbi:MAG: hypothetical protein Q9191_003653 [Dirinaria sp. TL-2023a]
MVSCWAHVAAAEFIPMHPSKGEVLYFRRRHVPISKSKKDEENPNDQNSPTRFLEKVRKVSKIERIHSAVKKPCSATFAWDSLNYEIRVNDEPKRLLNDLEGWVKPGSMTALMGASGAGKTTLLNVLADRTTTGNISGLKLIMSSREIFEQQSSYAQQEDVHVPTSTVREALEFSALLRQPKQYKTLDRLQYVDEVIAMLDMTPFADAVVGEIGEGLNVEQRKRLTIGVELAARSDFPLILDEPTSGLDSDTAWSICDLLRKLADQGQAILCTIHQPSAILFEMFDRLLLLTDGGKVAYFGAVGPESRTVTHYFEQHSNRFCPTSSNPAEWVLQIIHNQHSDTEMDWSQIWKLSNERCSIKSHIKEMANLELLSGRRQPTNQQKYMSPSTSQLQLVTSRLFQHYWRTPSYLYSKASLCIGSAFLIGSSFWMSPNTIQGIQNQVFAVFLLMTTFTNLDQQIIPQITAMRRIYEIRERPSRTFSWPVFILSHILVEIPWQTLMSVMLFVCWYYPIGMHKDLPIATASARSALVFLAIWSFMLFTSSLSLVVAVAIESAQTAVNIAQLLYSLSLIFCG